MGDLRSLLSLFSSNLAIDLGTTRTRIFAQGSGIVLDEPSAVAINTKHPASLVSADTCLDPGNFFRNL